MASSTDAPATTGGVHRGFRNARLYTWYSALFNSFFWMPIFFLYFNAHVTLEQVLLLEAIYYGSVALLEVPSGYFSDTVGRRITLLLSTLTLTGAYALFSFGDSFMIFAAAQVLLAAGIAFNSGTDTSFHYDALCDADATDEYDRREARIARNAFLAGAGSALIGGLLGAVDLSWAYLASLVVAASSIVVVLMLREPTRHDAPPDASRALVGQLSTLLGYFRNTRLRWVFAFSVLMTVLVHVPYEFYQPYLRLMFEQFTDADGAALPWLSSNATPISAGIHACAAMLIGAWCASQSVRFRDRFGLRTTLLTAYAVQVLQIALMAMVLHPLVAVVLVTRSAPRAIAAAPVNAATAPLLTQRTRATWFSLQSLVGRISFGLTLLGLSQIARLGTDDDLGTWAPLSNMLGAATFLGVLAGLVLIMMKDDAPAA